MVGPRFMPVRDALGLVRLIIGHVGTASSFDWIIVVSDCSTPTTGVSASQRSFHGALRLFLSALGSPGYCTALIWWGIGLRLGARGVGFRVGAGHLYLVDPLASVG